MNSAQVTDVRPSYIKAVIEKNPFCEKLLVTFNDSDHAFWNLYIDNIKIIKKDRNSLLRSFELATNKLYYIIEYKYENEYGVTLRLIVNFLVVSLSAFLATRVWSMYSSHT
jgi:hypothetical protein